MAEEANAATGTATDAGAGQGAQLSAGAAGAAGAAAGASAGQVETKDGPTVERHRLRDFGGDLGRYDRSARLALQAEQSGLFELGTLLQEAGYNPRQYIDLLRQTPAEQSTGAPAEAGPPASPSGDEPVTLSALDKWWNDREQARQRAEAERATQEREQRETEAAQQVRAGFTKSVLDELKMQPGSVGAKLLGPYGPQAIRDAIAESLAADARFAGYTAAQRLELAAGYVPTEAEVVRAKELFLKDVKDFGNTFVSDAAKGQASLPGASLAGGPSGGEAAGSIGPNATVQEMANYLCEGARPG